MAGDEQAIRTVISKQFVAEVAYKENELQKIDDRIQLAKMMLHRLRLGILAQQYGLSGFYLMEDYSKENIGVQASWKSFENEFLNLQEEEEVGARQKTEREEASRGTDRRKEVEMIQGRELLLLSSEGREGSTPDLTDVPGSMSSSVRSSQVPSEAGEDDIVENMIVLKQPPLEFSSMSRRVSSLLNDLRKDPLSPNRPTSSATATTGAASSSSCSMTMAEARSPVVCESDTPGPSSPPLPARFASKKRVIVGNTSQFLDRSARSTIDGSTHKWMVYVRGPNKEANISSYVKAVRFFLHPSYHPNDIIRISKPPFHLTRYGWGEFPVRVQLEFSDKRNKHVDIIHNLVLDRTHTGHQTLGSETIVDLDLVSTTRDSISLPPDPSDSSCSGGAGPKKKISVHPFSNRSSANDFDRTGKQHPSEAEIDDRIQDARIHTEKIHHIFIPASSTLDQVLLDHSYAQIVIVSERPQPHSQTSTVTTSSMDTTENRGERTADSADSEDDEKMILDDYLHSVVKTVPLCGPESNGFHLVAPSVDHFQKWNIGRRRASEWMRALTMKRLIKSMEPSPVDAATTVTTKQVMHWCRRNGYTPLDPLPCSSRGFCKYCGCQLSRSCLEDRGSSGGGGGGAAEGNSHPHCLDKMEIIVEEDREREEEESNDSSGSDSEEMEEEDKITPKQKWRSTATTKMGRHFSTLSDPFELLESLATKSKRIRMLREKRVREQEIDVESLPHPGQRRVFEGIPRFRVPQTPELKWVQQTAAAIGIRIFPAVIDHMYAHVVEHMIYMACTKFARVIIDRAITESARQVEGEEESSSDERCIVPLHIYHAVKSLESCDFLTNAYMGVPLEPPPAPPTQTTYNRTTSNSREE